MWEGFFYGLVIGLVVALPMVILANAFAQYRISSSNNEGLVFFARGDAVFQNWFHSHSGTRLLYAERLIIKVLPDELVIRPVWRAAPSQVKISYLEIGAISTERFRSRSAAGRGVRVRLHDGRSFCVRAEHLWLVPVLASPAMADDLASAIADNARSRHDGS